jgi:glycosyltransferase involved in cell wall biosynthesis
MIKKKNNIKFSIITVTKNSEKYLEKNILSLKEQIYKNYEHIIIDSNSTDRTKKILKKYKSGLKILSEDDNGLYDAMNKGIRLSSGEVIGILNSDDFYYPKALKIINDYFTKIPDIDFVFGSTIKYNKIMTGFYPWKIHWTFGFYTTHSVGFFIKKESQKKVGFYNTKFKYSSDYDLFYRMIVKKKMKGISTKRNELIGYFRPGGFSDKLKYINYLNENTKIRLHNKQNFFLVMSIHFLRYIKRWRLIKKESRKINR